MKDTMLWTIRLIFFLEKAGGCEIVAGDINGTVTSFQQHDALWKMNIAEESAKLATIGMVSR
jgi:hypothetical protein